MRTIKFRVWNKYLNQYDYITSPNGFKFWMSGHGDPPESPFPEMEQFTGLLDKNGKEIYEGDIVKSIDSDFNRVIKWSDITPSFTMQRDDFKECVWYNEKYCDVIGNIHENLELVQKSN